MHQIIGYLFLGNQQDAEINCDMHHVNCTVDLPRFNNPDKKFIRVSCHDTGHQDDFKIFMDCLPDTILFIEECINKKESVLVHCKMGQQRSPAIVAAFIMWYYAHVCTTLSDAVKYIKMKKHDAFLGSINFLEPLVEIEKQINIDYEQRRYQSAKRW